MANTYGSNTFVIDTDTNIAGLETLKGSAVAATDNICIKVNASFVPATLTIEKDITLLSLNIGYGAISGGSSSVGNCIVDDDVELTFAANGTIYLSIPSTFTCNGTMRSIGTGSGAADQTVTSRHANNQQLMVDGEWWVQVLDLTGRRVDVSATTNTTSVTVASGGNTCDIGPGATIEIRKRSDGSLKATKVVTGLTATTISWASGNVSVDSGDSVYLPIAGTDKVFMVSGTTVTFGDGTASAWNNNGGACPANGAAITQPGILLTCADMTDANRARMQQVLGEIDWTGVCMNGFRVSTAWWASHFYLHAATMSYCSFQCVSNHACNFAYGSRNITMDHCYGVANSTAGGGIVFSSGCSDIVLSYCWARCQVSYGALFFGPVRTVRVDNCYGWGANAPGIQIYYSNDIELEDCTGVSVGSHGLLITSSVSNFKLTNVVAVSLNNYGIQCQASNNKGSILSCTATSTNSIGLWFAYGCANIVVANTTASTLQAGGYVENLKVLGCRITGAANPRFYYGDGSIWAYRNAASGDAGVIHWSCGDMDIGGLPTGQSILLPTQNEWVTTRPAHIPGLSAYGNVSTSVTLNGGTTEAQYRVSHDWGQTWTEWAAVPATITDTPDPEGEFIQFRVRKTDAGATVPYYSYIDCVCTFVNGWTYDEDRVPEPCGRLINPLLPVV